MTQEDKELLLKDLCAKLPYGVKFGIGLGKLGKYDLVEINTKKGKVLFGHGLYTDLETCKLYLRPMSSMTEEERKELKELHFYYTDAHVINDEDKDFKPIIVDEVHCSCIIDWLNAHHFDYRGLIEKGLAIEVTKENNPYKE